MGNDRVMDKTMVYLTFNRRVIYAEEFIDRRVARSVAQSLLNGKNPEAVVTFTTDERIMRAVVEEMKSESVDRNPLVV